MITDKERALSRAERSKTQRYSDVKLQDYEYSELEDMKKRIRILKLDSSSIQNPIIDCELFEVEFDKNYVPHGVPDQEDDPSFTPFHLQRTKVEYEALSWCWGREAADHAIRIRRGDKKYKLRAKKELVLALKYLRHDEKDRYLWIDAVCINQANPTERNHQVQIMAMIYSRATKVCVWLGEDDDDSAMAIKFIKDEIMKLERFDDICKNKANADKWQALLALMQRPWFGRRWVAQEIALALEAQVYCGPDEIPWKDFAVAVELFVEVETATHRLSEVIQKDERFYHVPGWFEYVSHLGASLLVGATAKVFRATEIRRDENKNRKVMGNERHSEPHPMPDQPNAPTDRPTTDIAANDTPATTSETSHNNVVDESTPQAQRNSDAGFNLTQAVWAHRQLAKRETARAPSEDKDTESDSDAGGVSVDPRGRRGLLSLEYLVSTLFTFEATEPRDAIYALLAIAKDTSPSAEVNDYHGDKSKDALLLSTLSNFLEKKPYRVDYTLPYTDQASDPSRFLDILCRPWALKPPKADEDPAPSQVSRNKKKEAVNGSIPRQQTRIKGIFVDGKRVPLLEPRHSLEFKIRTEEAREAGHRDGKVASMYRVDHRSLADYREQVLFKEKSIGEGIRQYFPGALGNRSDGARQQNSLQRDISLPSWVATVDSAPFGLFHHPGMHFPRTGRKNADPLVGLPEDGDRNYSAAQKHKPEESEDKASNLEFRKRPVLGHYSFYVKGFVLDEIDEVAAPAYGGNIPKAWADVAFLRTLVADRGKGNRNPPHYYSKACRESISKGSIDSGRVNIEALINSEQNSIITEFCRRVQEVIWNRRLIKTKDGILGLAPEQVKPGDCVCIIYGCSVPVILRRQFKGDIISEETKSFQPHHRAIPSSTNTDMKPLTKEMAQTFIDAIERWNHCTGEAAEKAGTNAFKLFSENRNGLRDALQLYTPKEVRRQNLEAQLRCEEKEDEMERLKSAVHKYEARQVRKARYRELCNNGFKYGKIRMSGVEYKDHVKSATDLVTQHLKILKEIAKSRQEAENQAREKMAMIAKDRFNTKPGKEDTSGEENSDEEHFYYVMGESYIHGMMDGDAIREKFKRKLRQHLFELR
ncbi:hypothetical protein PG996_009982 [Apiospora saccharicola]|uniref:Heterokaryon incompatibility domain-containing protein n=1 Tax=Apiospora saccharicola TaxID=335842 RepID=A0ABR1UMZ2_9PEZI